MSDQERDELKHFVERLGYDIDDLDSMNKLRDTLEFSAKMRHMSRNFHSRFLMVFAGLIAASMFWGFWEVIKNAIRS